MVITRAEAERLLRQDLVRFEKGVRDRASSPPDRIFDSLRGAQSRSHQPEN